jgi:DNA-binding NarL/FixJ family response regulator
MPQDGTARFRQAIPGVATIAIFCADRIRCESLTKAFREDGAIAIAGVSEDSSGLRALINRACPDALVADRPARELLAEWRRRHGQMKLVVLLEDPQAQEGIGALAAGAQAILPRASPAGDIVNAIKALAAGYAVVPPGVLSRLLTANPMVARSFNGKDGAHFTPRELDVIGAMADGASNKAIARRLGISFHTVKFHVASVLAKLDADSRTEAVAKAAQLGLVML